MQILRCLRACFWFPALGLLPAAAHAEIRYVHAASTTGANDGTSWSNAFRGSNGLRQALEFAVAGDELWVAEGTYLPTRTGDRLRSFTLTDGLALYGGFVGIEVDRGERDPLAHETILSGDLGGDDGAGNLVDNSLCVLRMGSSLVDGFTITAGNADGSGSTGSGAGIQVVGDGSESVVRRCVLRGNRCSESGAGVWFEGVLATFENCAFEENSAASGGGAFIRSPTGVLFKECRFEGNVATSDGGAAYVSDSYDAYFVRCDFRGNSAPSGGAILFAHNNASLSSIQECLVAGNTSTGGAVVVSGGVSNLDVLGSTITANTGGGILLGPANEAHLEGTIVSATGPSTFWQMSVRYSCTDSLEPGPGNIAADPQFVDAPGGNFRLLPTSPCIDASAETYYRPGYDLDRTARREDVPTVPDSGLGTAPQPDMGAYETPGGLYTLACGTDTALVRSCPCANEGIEGAGCANSSSSTSGGSFLEASGAANPDTVRMRATAMPLSTTCVLLQGNAISGTGFLLGDGVRCVGGALKRMSTHTTTNGMTAFPDASEPGLKARSAALGDPIAPGTRRHYQVWYRDPNPGFCPIPTGGTSNLTSGITVYW